MKFFLCAILVMASTLKLVAQTGDSTIKYIWKNETTHIIAAIEMYGLQKNKSACSMYFLKNVDTAYNSATDSLLRNFTNISFLNCPVIIINFYNYDDSVSDNNIKLYSNTFTKFILPEIEKKYPALSASNIIVSGINDLALVALLSTINNPFKIKKTALFFNDKVNFSAMTPRNLETSKNLKGKLFIYVNHQNYTVAFKDSFIANLALESSAVFYKYDHYDNPLPHNLFMEAYKWLMADGNNYIIKNNH